MATEYMKGGEMALSGLAAIADKIKSAAAVKVGFLAGATYPGGQSVAMIAAIQNFGAPAAGIPPRPFFSNMIVTSSPGWGPSLATILKANDYDSAKSLDLMGDGIAGQLRQSIIDTNAPPLAKSTIARKGHAKPLVDRGHMLNSTGWEVVR